MYAFSFNVTCCQKKRSHFKHTCDVSRYKCSLSSTMTTYLHYQRSKYASLNAQCLWWLSIHVHYWTPRRDNRSLKAIVVSPSRALPRTRRKCKCKHAECIMLFLSCSRNLMLQRVPMFWCWCRCQCKVIMVLGVLQGERRVLPNWTLSWRTCGAFEWVYAFRCQSSTYQSWREELTSSKSSYLSWQFSQYPGLGSLLVIFFFLLVA